MHILGKFTGIVGMVLAISSCTQNRQTHIVEPVSTVTALAQGGKLQYDPWGVWNEYPVSKADRIRTFSTGEYYEEPFGLYIVKYCYDAIAGGGNFSAFALPGIYTEIEKYEPIDDGFVFYLVGVGFKSIIGDTIFQKNTRVQVNMHFVSENECYFKYVSLTDDNGFMLSYFPKENVKYIRLKVKGIVGLN